LRTLPEIADVNTDQQNKGSATNLVGGALTAARFGITSR